MVVVDEVKRLIVPTKAGQKSSEVFYLKVKTLSSCLCKAPNRSLGCDTIQRSYYTNC